MVPMPATAGNHIAITRLGHETFYTHPGPPSSLG